MPFKNTQMINYCNIDITDWIQAIGSVFAIIGVIWGFVTIFRRDINKEKQISSLTKIAEQSENNTIQLSYQLRELIKQNEIFEKQVDLLSKMFSINQQTFELEKQRNELSEQKRIMSIKPNFVFLTAMRNLDRIEMSLSNEGDTAILKEIVMLEKNSMRVEAIAKNGQTFKRFAILPFKFFPFPGFNIPNSYCHIKLIYSDSEGREYYQILEGSDAKIIIHTPEKIEK